VDSLVFDLRLALRGLRRDPGFCLTAIATLAVALALTVTVYTIRDAQIADLMSKFLADKGLD
jgi:hypothetical protein